MLGKGVNGCRTLFKMLFVMHYRFIRVRIQINIFKVLFSVGGRGSEKNSTQCTLLIRLTIMDDPLYIAILSSIVKRT